MSPASASASTSTPTPTPASQLPGPAEEHWAWQMQAACRGLGDQRFFHPAGERGEARTARDRAAKRICAGCPVRAECLRHALSVGETYGVWGGLTEEERRALAVRRYQ
ncbi:transcription factor WhiB [Streptomyces venezuelae]|uniref:Transcriptional regulator WhiB n=1 Tax=Streptomyces venezuelae TaxID=54571 RepID=A0A5P2CY48_STRVZ|nr:WhiB family transcriptional regulator [Streptomyces venezuelae]QES46897.1 transcription factor WhiB [Streptomyces venezuelae]